jgi:hypothetical protein
MIRLVLYSRTSEVFRLRRGAKCEANGDGRQAGIGSDWGREAKAKAEQSV